MVAVVLYGCFILSKYVAKKMNNSVSGKNIKIIERVALGQDKGLTLCKICNKVYLIAVSNQSISILAELNPEDFVEKEEEQKTNFVELFNKAIKSNKNKQP